MTTSCGSQVLLTLGTLPQCSTKAVEAVTPQEMLKTNSQRRARRIRPRKAAARQLVLEDEEMLKIPSPDMLNNMMRGVKLNGEL
ncbi:unnamed protein product [Cylicostephanus goldi]|uniref:Uncharacterized protein n=1 Tax=Cylicostephanus goldi TaxID=71465 RepID=A0A3P7Q050_CYLGO|nr:unnamed protein product [Cylicostephanus goldi]